MLQNTFCHIPGIGPRTESKLWNWGIQTWSDLLEREDLPLPPSQALRVRAQIHESVARLAANDVAYFYRLLPSHQHWRLFAAFRRSVAYVDIETTGLGNPGDIITTIAVHDGEQVHHYIQGRTLDAFAHDIDCYQLLISYNGKCFDVPFIRSYLGAPMPHAHIDLRYVLSSLGYRGGLKRCERMLGIDRQDLADVDGYFAVLLWQDYVGRSNPRALETLLAYNVLDVLNLETLMVIAYNLKLENTPFSATHCLPPPDLPPNPFRADAETVARLRRRHYWSGYARGTGRG